MRKLLLALFFSLAAVAQAAAQSAVFVPATMATIPIAGTIAGATKIIPGLSGKYTYITSLMLAPAAATAAVTFTAGTGTNCGTNTTSLTGVMTFGAAQTFIAGSGYGAILVAPKGYDICITIAAEATPGSIGYAQF